MPVATAVNMTVVRKKDRAQTELKGGDRIEILVPMQGG
jgi:thiamine biosynthesis protein ThiS